MARKTKEEAENTRKRILASALSLFADRGYEHTTFNDIADRLKLTKGAIYWHFDSKEALLVALVDEMLAKFQSQLYGLMPKEELTFMAVADTLVHNAELIVSDPETMAFFMLMKTKISWRADSMSKVRERLMSRQTNGPYHSIISAIENDIAARKVREDVNPIAVASVCLSIYDGLIQAKIEKFLNCDLETTLQRSFAAMWNSIKVVGG